MTKSFSDFTEIFFWNFKRMDNVNYNFEILEILFKAKNTSSQNTEFNKPIILLLAAIIECILYDFIRRITEHRHEIIEGLDESIIDDTKEKICDQFEPLIAHVKKHDLLESNGKNNIYNNLDFIRKLRNRIHIQNRQQQLDKDEDKIWTHENVFLTSECLEEICNVLCNCYPRPKKQLLSMSDFPRPWETP